MPRAMQERAARLDVVRTPRKVSVPIWLALATAAALAPFLNKAFHIDDPLFLWMAEQIARHPLDPYGFTVNWAGAPQPMWVAMQNPPLCSYFIAAVSALFGSNEIALHLTFLFWAVAVVLGTFALARRFCRLPAAAALLTLCTPVFLVSATSVMCDVMMLAFYVWSVELWIAGLEQKRWWQLALSALLISAATLTKYFGITAVPLLGVYTIARDRRSWAQLFWLVLPVAVTLGYEHLTKIKYGFGLFTGATAFARAFLARSKYPFPAQLLCGLAFLGGCAFGIVFFLPLRSRRSLFPAAVSLAGFLVAFYFLVPREYVYPENNTLVWMEGGTFAGIGSAILALAFWDLFKQRNADALLLLLWILGTFCFATFCNWSITARTVLPLVPAVAILVIRNFGPTLQPSSLVWRIGASGAIALALGIADYRQAGTALEASDVFRARFGNELGTVWFQSHWGFQFYMQQWGARSLNVLNSQISSGDVMLVPANNTAVKSIPPEWVFSPEERIFPTVPFITLHGAGTGAGFYSSVRGPIPWVIDHVPPEKYYIARFR